MGLRQEKKAQQRQAIVETALELFQIQGYEGTRIQDVVQRLRISEGTFFNYFPTKQALLDAAIDVFFDRPASTLRVELEPDKPVLDHLEDMVRDFVSYFALDPGFARLVALNFQRWLASGQQRETFVLLTRLVEEGQRRGEIRQDLPTEQVTEILTGVLLVTISNWLLAPCGDATPAPMDALDQRLIRACRFIRDGAAAPVSEARVPTRVGLAQPS